MFPVLTLPTPSYSIPEIGIYPNQNLPKIPIPKLPTMGSSNIATALTSPGTAIANCNIFQVREDLISVVTNSIQELADMVTESVASMFDSVTNSITTAVSESISMIYNRANEAISFIRDTIMSGVAPLIDSAISILNDIYNSLNDYASEIASQIKEVVDSVYDEITSLYDTTIGPYIDSLIDSTKEMINDAISVLSDSVSEILNSLMHTIGDGLSDGVINVFKNLSQSIGDLAKILPDPECFSSLPNIIDTVNQSARGYTSLMTTKANISSNINSIINSSVNELSSHIENNINSSINSMVNGLNSSVTGTLGGVVNKIGEILTVNNNSDFPNIGVLSPIFGDKISSAIGSEISNKLNDILEYSEDKLNSSINNVITGTKGCEEIILPIDGIDILTGYRSIDIDNNEVPDLERAIKNLTDRIANALDNFDMFDKDNAC